MNKVDIAIRKGRVIDTYNNIDRMQDIAIKDGIIVDSANVTAEQEIDATGCIVTPGLIDFHTHVAYAGITELGIQPDAHYLPTGVTTVVDAGSTGVSNFESFRTQTQYSQMRIKAFINVCSGGLVASTYHENLDPAAMNKGKLKKFLSRYKDQLLGLKIRFSKELLGDLGKVPLEATIAMAEEFGCPVCVHTTNCPIKISELAGMLRPGDIYAHMFQGKGNTIVEDGKVSRALRDAQEKGLILDAANGGNHFSFAVADVALAEGVLPDVISTDLSIKTLLKGSKVFSLPFVMSKYLAYGVDLKKIISCVTQVPARLLGDEKNLGSLSIGSVADVTIQKIADHKTVFSDFFGVEKEGTQVFKTEMTIVNGVVLFRQIDF